MVTKLSYYGLAVLITTGQSVLALCADMSPADTRDAHMVLVMDMLEVEHHAARTAQVLEQFGKVMSEIDL